MSNKITDQSIILKDYLTGKDYAEIKELMELCYSNDHTNLKLELDYKLTITKNPEIGIKNANEYLYYADGILVSYLGISNFGGSVYELNGMTHPAWRRKGLLHKLFKLALQESQNNGHKELLLLSDEKSESGKQFIHSVGGNYKFSEYRMVQINKINAENNLYENHTIRLKIADKDDLKEICRQNAIYFNTTEESEAFITDETMLNDGMYLIEQDGKIIGKINVEYNDNSAFIFGFGIMPDFRGKGYGKAALNELLKLIIAKGIDDIQLDVECNNKNALNLYKAFGFEEKSVMNYYEFKIKS